jgi:hypothetical protein
VGWPEKQAEIKPLAIASSMAQPEVRHQIAV